MAYAEGAAPILATLASQLAQYIHRLLGADYVGRHHETRNWQHCTEDSCTTTRERIASVREDTPCSHRLLVWHAWDGEGRLRRICGQCGEWLP